MAIDRNAVNWFGRYHVHKPYLLVLSSGASPNCVWPGRSGISLRDSDRMPPAQLFPTQKSRS